MALMQNFILPVLKVAFYLGVFGSLAFFISKAIVKRWLKTWKYTLRYKIFRKKMPEQTVAWCMDAIETRQWTYFKTKKYLYLNDVSQEKVDETMYIFLKVERQLWKGGVTNGRISSRSDSKIKGTENLPKI